MAMRGDQPGHGGTVTVHVYPAVAGVPSEVGADKDIADKVAVIRLHPTVDHRDCHPLTPADPVRGGDIEGLEMPLTVTGGVSYSGRCGSRDQDKADCRRRRPSI